MDTQHEGESAATTRPAFDAGKYLVSLNGRGEYLEVKWRLLWLRTEHPDAKIETEAIRIEERDAIFKATVTIPNNGGKATGWGSESAGDFRDFIEKAETKAIGRALAALGYGTQFCQDHEHGDTGYSPRSQQQATPPARQQTAPPAKQQTAPTRTSPPAKTAPASADDVRGKMGNTMRDPEAKAGTRIAALEWLMRDAEHIERVEALWKDARDNGLVDEKANTVYQQALIRFNPAMAG